MTTLNPWKRYKEKQTAETARREAAVKAYDAKYGPVYAKYRDLIQYENNRYERLRKPIDEEHRAEISKLFDRKLEEIKALDKETLKVETKASSE